MNLAKRKGEGKGKKRPKEPNMRAYYTDQITLEPWINFGYHAG
jgi:hypothetical protein